jgi:hypothetical protein
VQDLFGAVRAEGAFFGSTTPPKKMFQRLFCEAFFVSDDPGVSTPPLRYPGRRLSIYLSIYLSNIYIYIGHPFSKQLKMVDLWGGSIYIYHPKQCTHLVESTLSTKAKGRYRRGGSIYIYIEHNHQTPTKSPTIFYGLIIDTTLLVETRVSNRREPRDGVQHGPWFPWLPSKDFRGWFLQV